MLHGIDTILDGCYMESIDTILEGCYMEYRYNTRWVLHVEKVNTQLHVSIDTILDGCYM